MNNSNLSTMFLNDVTTIDLAYVCSDGSIRGLSVRPQIKVTGLIDPEEKVVVDFSTVKKFMKAKIDDKELGYDHKLCVPLDALSYVKTQNVDGVYIQTPMSVLRLPRNAVRVFSVGRSIHHMHKELQQYLDACLREEYGTAFHSVEVSLDQEIQAINDLVQSGIGRFNYVHGLKSSTSWGCQNIAHGHSSFFQFFGSSNEERRNDTEQSEYELILRIEEELRDAVFVFDENIVRNDPDVAIVQYSTGRGDFYAEFSIPDHNVHILKTETTIEYLVSYFTQMYGRDVRNLGYRYIAVSEGLCKGAVIDLYPDDGNTTGE